MFACFPRVAPRSVFRMVWGVEAQANIEMAKLALHFWITSLGNSYTLAKAMWARDTSTWGGSRARGEGRERGYFN